MANAFRRYATPLITGLFLVSLISGIALFLHFGTAYFREMHEWLSLVLVLPFVLHLWRNWRAMMVYVGKLPLTIAMLGSVAAGLAFAWPALMGTTSMRAGGPPQIAFVQNIAKNTLGEIAPLLGSTAANATTVLSAAGFTAATADKTLENIATDSGKDIASVIAVLNTIQ